MASAAAVFHRSANLPLDAIANPHGATVENLPEDSATPVGLKGATQAGSRFIHALARRQLTADQDAAGTNEQDAPTRARQFNAADQDVRPS